MEEYEENRTNENPGADNATYSAAVSRMAGYVKKSEERLALLEAKGGATKADFYDAMYERGEKGEPLLSISLMMEFIDPVTSERRRLVEKINTADAVADFMDVNGKGTLILYFDKKVEASRMLKALDNYGRLASRTDVYSSEIPNAILVLVPYMLGGKYALFANNPMQWVPLSQSGEPGVVDELRIYFDSPECGIFCDPEFDAMKVTKEIRSMMLSARWEDEQRQKMIEEKKKYEEQRELEHQEAIEKERKAREKYNIV